MSPAKHKDAKYDYTLLRELPDSGRVYVYGVVVSISDTAFGGPIIEIKDEDGSAIVKVRKESSKYFHNLQVNDILRLHRVEIVPHGEGFALLVDVNNCGCHAISWRGDSTKPRIATSKSYTLTDNDHARLSNLRKLLHAVDPVEAADNPVSEVREDANQMCTDAQAGPSVLRSPEKRTLQIKKPRTVEDITNAMDIPHYGSRFFNFHAQVLGVYKGKGEPFVVFVRVWDGTRPRFPMYRNMFRADLKSIETTYCEISPAVYCAIEPFTIDVCCYGDWGKKAMSLQLGDVVYLCNIRNYTSQSNGYSAVTMHEGGLQFGRALEVLDEKHPKHFEISKQCADALSKNFGSGCALQSSSSTINLTPIVPENVVAQSTPTLSKDNHLDNSPNQELGNPADLSASSNITPAALQEAVSSREQRNDRSSNNQVEELASDTPLSNNVPFKGPNGVLVEVNTNVTVVEKTPDREVQVMSRRKTRSRTAAEKLNKVTPSPKRRYEREWAANETTIRQQETSQAVDESPELGPLDFCPPSTSSQCQKTPPVEEPSAKRRRSGRTSDNVHNTPRKHVFLSTKKRSDRSLEELDAVIEESPEEQVAGVIVDEYADEAAFEAALVDEAEDKDACADDQEPLEDSIEKLRNVFLKSEFESHVAELRRLVVLRHTLGEEMEEILKLDVGTHVCLGNFVEPYVEVLKEPDYLRKALVFTAKCVVCSDEFIVDKASKTWCRKCFVEQKQLSQVLYSYRITVPVVYKRSDATPAQLLLEIARKEWSAFPTSGDLFSNASVMGLFLENDLRKFAVQLNHIIRFAEAVMKSRRILVFDAKIHDLRCSEGSVTLFVDKCVFASKGR